jgi:hypothetical protein
LLASPPRLASWTRDRRGEERRGEERRGVSWFCGRGGRRGERKGEKRREEGRERRAEGREQRTVVAVLEDEVGEEALAAHEAQRARDGALQLRSPVHGGGAVAAK